VDQRIIGTTQRGYVSASYADLVAHFGPPQLNPNDKSLARWVVSTPYGWGTVYDMLGEEPGPIEENRNWHLGGHNDETVDDICAQLRQQPGASAHVQATRYEVCALPPHYKAWRLFTLAVEYRGEGLWAVLYQGRCIDADGNNEWEPSTSNRSDDFLARFRLPLDQALAIASKFAPTVETNGITVADALAHGPDWL